MEKDISTAGALSLDVFNPAPEPVQISVAFLTGDQWKYYETKLIAIDEGWHRGIALDLNALDYKSESSGWEFKTALNDRSKLHQIVLLIYNARKTATLLFDNIRLE